MSASTSNSIRHPNLIFIAPFPGGLDIVACAENWRSMQVVWHERRPLAEQASFLPCLSDILKQHALPANTRTVMIVPPGVGGLLVSPAIENACSNAAWCQRQLELSLPYPLAEIRYGMRCAGDLIQFFWVPNDWLNSQKATLQKFGLKLEEVFPRALLFETGQPSPAPESVLSERFVAGELLYCLRGGHIHQALALPAGLDESAHETYLNGIAASSANPAQAAVVSLPAWNERLPALWNDIELTVAGDATAGSLWSPFFRLAMIVIVVAAALAGFLAWQMGNQEEALTNALREKKRLAQPVQRFQELDRLLREEGAVVAAVGKMNNSSTPLPLLTQFTRILPKDAWVQQLVFDGKAMVVSGKGIGDAELIGLLQGANIEVIQMRQEPVAETKDFRLRILGKPEPTAGGAP